MRLSTIAAAALAVFLLIRVAEYGQGGPAPAPRRPRAPAAAAGPATVGLYDPASAAWFLRYSNSAGPAGSTFVYGPAATGWAPLTGDWNGDGVETPGLFNDLTSFFFLRNVNFAGAADLVFGYGPPGAGWRGVAGDWNGDGLDTPGLYHPATSTFFLRNTNTAGPANATFTFGPAASGWIPVAGDWNGDGIDTIGLYNSLAATFYLRNVNASGPADLTFTYGPPGGGWLPIVGDWNGDGVDTIGLYHAGSAVFALKNTNTAGPADLLFIYGPPGVGWRPITGAWLLAGVPVPVLCVGCWTPGLVTGWQWQLTTPVDQSVVVAMYDIDMFDNEASVVASLHAAGRKVVCYISAGSWENWRPDAASFPESVKGNTLSGFPDERWLDIRQLAILRPLMDARLDVCKSKGFDGVELDNMDGYANNSGFPLTATDQLIYNATLANDAHTRGLSVALKNDVEQVLQLLPYFDWTLNEQCFEFNECTTLLPFINAGKAVMHVEYNLQTSQFCPQANAMNFNSMKKHVSLDAFREPCR